VVPLDTRANVTRAYFLVFSADRGKQPRCFNDERRARGGDAGAEKWERMKTNVRIAPLPAEVMGSPAGRRTIIVRFGERRT
jgi:hypothetical protein